jgi:glycosyltransferase involved in cell wall biosynthesis
VVVNRVRRVLLLNWRDPWHPRAGGAEHLTWRVLQRLAARGWSIEWFSGAYPGAAADETREGVRFVRAGSAMTVHLHAFRRYARRTDFELVIDEINTIPFFTPWYAARSIALIFQLAREVWLYEGGALGRIGFAAEPFYLRPYRSTPLLTISESSAQTLRAIGLRGPLRILPIAVDEPADAAVPAKTIPRDLLVVGRVTPSKRIEESVEAAALLRAGGWRGRLRIVGSGPPAYRAALERRIGQLGLGDVVGFTGRIDDDARRDLMRAASALWMTSAREGWGLVVTEAARHGTPAVVYDVPGLRDAVADGVSGRVVEPRPVALADATRELFADFDAFALRALDRARPLSWDGTADAFARAVDELIPS